MKRLIICRHAKSSWDDPFLGDQERPLAARGLRDAPEMALRLKKRGIHPDLIVSSNAVRALQTAQITADILGIARNKISVNANLYHGSYGILLRQIKFVLPDIGTVYIFGHNPGMNELINFLGDPIDNLPTCGQYGFEFAVDRWEDVAAKNARFLFFDFPKSKFSDI